LKITQGQKDFEQTLQFIKKKRQKEIKRGQQEVANIKDYYDKAVSKTKEDGETRYYEAKLKNENKLDQAYQEGLANFEEKQFIFDKDLEKVKEAFENEKKLYQSKLKELNRRFNIKLLDRTEFAEDILSKVDDEHREAILNLEEKSSKELAQAEMNALKKIKSNQLRNRIKMEQQKNDFIKKMGDEGLLLDEKLKNERLKSKKNLNDLLRLQEIKRQQTVKRHHEILETKKDHHKEQIKSEDKSFGEKFRVLKEDHKEVLDRVKKLFDRQKEELIKSHSKIKKTLDNKLEDDFYHVKVIEPKLVDNGKEYLLSIEVPPHEKETAHVAARNRNINITLARRFEDRIENNDGTVDKSRRSEIFSKSIQTDEIMDHTRITQKYENGHLIFKIPKK
tara:strand:+ start:154 stop:1329 length:1176 start_codon:yes stop_codon:yes gene_type:complete